MSFNINRYIIEVLDICVEDFEKIINDYLDKTSDNGIKIISVKKIKKSNWNSEKDEYCNYYKNDDKEIKKFKDYY